MTKTDKERLDAIEKKIDNIEKELNRALGYLESDQTTNQQGVVEKLNFIDLKLGRLILSISYFKGMAAVWGVVGAAVYSLIAGVILYIIKSKI